ncbi:MAG: hypothetical protein BRD30_08860 [Bacteroidetes bacterium QH_2_63_10]|nr:MAG: hypothetical protein BRD30_08860 [Bacteroidetes bacterium QH_2_63_10]
MISHSPVIMLAVLVLSIAVVISVYYGIQDDSSTQRRRRRARQREDHRRAMEESRDADGDRNATEGDGGVISSDDAVKNWLNPGQQSDQ